MTDAQKRALLVSAKGIGSPARLVLLALTTFLGEGERCWPSNETLAGLVDLSVRRVQVALAELKERGVVKIEVGKDGRRVISVGVTIPAGDVVSVTGGMSFPSGGDDVSVTSQVYRREGDIEGGSGRGPAAASDSKSKEDAGSKAPPGAASDSRPPRSAGPSQEFLGEVPRISGMGRSEGEWAALFKELMLVVGRKLEWHFPTVPLRLRGGFQRLHAMMLAQGWWPSAEQLKAVRWRYAQARQHPVSGCLGGHRKVSGPAYFLEDFFLICQECETEWNFVHGVASAPLFEEPLVEDHRGDFLEKPIEEWTDEELRNAILWREVSEPVAIAETTRRRIAREAGANSKL
jgi:hypothetical protein